MFLRISHRQIVLPEFHGFFAGTRRHSTAVIKLSIDQGWIEEEKDWPDSVTIEERDDCYLFTVRTCGAYWLERWVLSLGPAAEVIEPEFLRKKISGDVKKVAEMYK